MKNKNTIYGFMISILLLSMSCKKGENNSVASGVATIQVGLAESGFEGVDNVNFASMQRESLVQEDQHVYVPIGDGYSLSVVLSEDNPSSPSNQNGQTNTIVKKAVVERTPLGNNIRYKLVVFRSSGEYVLERDYVRGQEGTAASLLLDGGVAYTFVAYSVNSTSALPAIVFSDPANRTLATGSLQNVSTLDNTNYLMHYMATVTPEGGRTTNLAVILVHKLSQVIATVDASALDLNINALDAYSDTHRQSVSMTLTGETSRTGGTVTRDYTFPTLGSQRVVSTPTLLNTRVSTGVFIIRNITIGTMSRSNVRISGLEIVEGRKYNLTIKVNPTDIYFSDETSGIPVARIAGMVWARHNLGANTSLNPDNSSSHTSALAGNYFQWGVSNSVASATTGAGAISPWNTPITNSTQTWNALTDANPSAKRPADPCPDGFRVPTENEFSNLMSSTTWSRRTGNGATTWTSDPNNFSNVVNFISTTNPNVRLVFPVVGYRRASDGTLASRSLLGGYYSSRAAVNGQGESVGRYMLLERDSYAMAGTSKAFAHNIRCIRHQN